MVAGTATVNALASNGAITGTTGAFSTSLYSATFNTAGTATVNALASNVYGSFGQNVTVNSANASTSTGTGALIVTSGGVGVGGAIHAGGQIYTATTLNVAGTATVNALIGNVFARFGQNVEIDSTNASISTTTGAFQVAGGAGIVGNVNAGGSRSLFTGAIGIGTSTAAGMIAAAGVSNDAYVWGNVRIANTATSSGIVFSDGTVQTTAGSPALKTNSFGTAGTIQFAGAGNTFAGDTATFFYDDTNNRLGIGTATPGQTISAYSAEAVLFNTRPGGAARQEITVGNVTTYGAVLGYDPSIGNSIGYLRRGDSAAGTPAITWAYGTGAYRVGINGVTQPQNTMDISGTVAIGSGFSGLAVMTNTNGMSVQGSVGIGTFTPSTSANNLTLWSATGAGIELASGGAAGGGNIQAITGSGLKFATFTGGVGAEVYTERMRIDSNGDIGLGVVDPLSTVDVGGIASFRGAVSIAGATTVASLTSNGAVSGTTGTFTGALYGGSFNSAGTATVAAVVSNGTVTGTSLIPSSATVPTNGIYLPAANTVGIAAGGLEELRVTTTGVGIGGAQQSSFNVTVNGGALGTVANSQVRMLNIYATDTNASSLEFSDIRNASGGADWTTAGMRMQQKIDATYMGWIGFNNGNTVTTNNNGISFGAGGSTLGPNGVPEVMRIASNGNIGVNTTTTTNAKFSIVGGTGSAGELYLNAGTNFIRMGSNLSAGSYNSLVQAGDQAMIFSGGTQTTTGALVIGPWTALTQVGLRMPAGGNLLIGTTTSPLGAFSTEVVNSTNGGGTEWVSNNSGGGNIQALSGGGLQIGTFTGAVGAEVYTALVTLNKPGTNATGNLAVKGNITATGEVTAYYSDSRLKDNITLITNAMDKVSAINGVYYNPSQLAETLLHESRLTSKVGLIAQEVEAVLPHVIRAAPFDTNIDGSSKSGENYKTIQYEKVIPLLVEAIKELEARIAKLEGRS